MAIVTLDECLTFLDIDKGYFVITKANNVLRLTSSKGGPVSLELTPDNYSGEELATHVETQLNNDATLTGDNDIVFVVSYSTSTRKFTIDAGLANTISYIHESSSGGLTIGFEGNKTASQTITSDIGSGDPTQIVDTIRGEVERFISEECKRTFEETSHRLKGYDGNGNQFLLLDDYPLISVDRVAIGTLPMIKVKNTNTYSTASVSVSSTGVRLVLDGTSTSVTFAANVTMTAVVAAINALGNGWQAELTSVNYRNYRSVDLIPVHGLTAIEDWAILSKPERAIGDFHVELGVGKLRRLAGWPKGFKNIICDYSAGYADADMPKDLQLAVKIFVKYILDKRDEGTFGMTEYRIGYNSVLAAFEKESFPKEVLSIIRRYKRRKA